MTLPTPDFSMPYNVICLGKTAMTASLKNIILSLSCHVTACTVAALAFGPIHNITTKTLNIVSPGEVEPGLVTKILRKIKTILRLDKKQKSEEPTETEALEEDASVGSEDTTSSSACVGPDGDNMEKKMA